MHKRTIMKILTAVMALFSLCSMLACADRVYAPREPYIFWYYPKSLVEDADRVIKDAERNCPGQLAEAKAVVDKAYAEYAACLTPVIRFQCAPPPPRAKAPTCELKADKTEINPGESVTLSMTTSGEVTSTDLEGTRDKTKTVSPTATTTYSGRVEGPGGSNQCSPATVTVRKKPPTCELKADKTKIDFGKGSVTLTLKTFGEVTSAMIDNESVATTGGTITRKPEKATRFTATVAGPGGSNTCTAPVSVSLALMVHFPFDRPKEMGNKKFPHDDPETWFDKPDAFNPKDSLDPCKGKKGSLENRNLEGNKALLQKAVDFVKNNPGTDIVVTGHTDCLGSAEYNAKLSDRRAQAVAAYIKKQAGLGNISWKGLGFSEPVSGCDQYTQGKCDREACDCRANNRRVVITVSPR